MATRALTRVAGTELASEAEIRLVAYEDEWPKLFQSERALLLSVLAPYVAGSIEHIGSTAVPGLIAKPVIDIMAGVRNLSDSRPALGPLEKLGYQYFPYRPAEMHWLCKPSPQLRTHHLHLVPYGTSVWNERLAFRDYLRSHLDVAQEYAALKLALADKFRFDRESYTDAKAPFVRRILAAALPATENLS